MGSISILGVFWAAYAVLVAASIKWAIEFHLDYMRDARTERNRRRREKEWLEIRKTLRKQPGSKRL